MMFPPLYCHVLPPLIRAVHHASSVGTLVDYNTREPTGTIIIDTSNTYLYLVLGQGKALRYGIGLGREGFTWSGADTKRRAVRNPR